MNWNLGWRSGAAIAAGLLLLGSWQWWSWATAPTQSMGKSLPSPLQVQIAPGTPADQVGEDLYQKGLIRSALAWKLWVRWQSWRSPQAGVQAGTYELSPTQSLPTIATRLWQGDVIQTRFTIPEGWSIRQMSRYLEQLGLFPAADFEQATRRIPRDEFAWLPANLTSLEGFLFPDTYQIPAGAITPEEVIRAMLKRFSEIALPLYRQAPSAQLTLAQWVTLSSIVEKEAVVPQERTLIAGVFLNRLRLNMPLGADPTVEYALGIQQTPDRPLTLAQVQTPSPYNTYLNAGLPPGAIASPGRASLEAVLTPARTDYLYFVARYDGTHIFSRTLAEHEIAQARIHDQRQSGSRL